MTASTLTSAFKSTIDRVAGGIVCGGLAVTRLYRNADVMANDRLRHGLVLSLDHETGGNADFMFTADPARRDDIDIWHPLPEIEHCLDVHALKRMLNALADAELKDTASAERLRLALLGKRDVNKLELHWTDEFGAPRCWLVSTCHDTQTVTGLVRDVSQASALVDAFARGLPGSPERQSRSRLTNASVAAAIRQQARVISSICDLLADLPPPDLDPAACRRSDFVSDVRSAIHELVSVADLLRDYTEAEHGCLKLEPQRWPVTDILARAMPGMKRLLERHGVHLTCQHPPPGAVLNADLSRIAMLLQLATCTAMSAMMPGRTAEMVCTIPPAGGIAFTWMYEGARLDETLLGTAHPYPSAARIACIELMHPAISSGFMKALLEAHDGELLPAPASGINQAVTLHLHDLRIA